MRMTRRRDGHCSRTRGVSLTVGVGVLISATLALAALPRSGSRTPARRPPRPAPPALGHGAHRIAGGRPVLTAGLVGAGVVHPAISATARLRTLLHLQRLIPARSCRSVTPGEALAISCSGWLPDDQVLAFEISPLALATDSVDDDRHHRHRTVHVRWCGQPAEHLHRAEPVHRRRPRPPCARPTAAQVAGGFLPLRDHPQRRRRREPRLPGRSRHRRSTTPPWPRRRGRPRLHRRVSAWPRPRTAAGTGWRGTTARVTTHGDAAGYGDASSLTLSAPISHIVADHRRATATGWWPPTAGPSPTVTPASSGRWADQPLNRPVVDLAPTPDNHGYWLVASDGGHLRLRRRRVPRFHGRTTAQPARGRASPADDRHRRLLGGGVRRGDLRLRRPVPRVDRQPHPQPADQRDDRNRTTAAGTSSSPPTAGSSPSATPGSTDRPGTCHLNGPVVGMALDPATGGYWLVGADGGDLLVQRPVPTAPEVAGRLRTAGSAPGDRPPHPLRPVRRERSPRADRGAGPRRRLQRGGAHRPRHLGWTGPGPVAGRGAGDPPRAGMRGLVPADGRRRCARARLLRRRPGRARSGRSSPASATTGAPQRRPGGPAGRARDPGDLRHGGRPRRHRRGGRAAPLRPGHGRRRCRGRTSTTPSTATSATAGRPTCPRGG